jgi:MFS family permease
MIRALVFFVVFGSGAALMSLEMTGLRLVEPEFGSDIYVTGSLISVFLGGLAAGAYLGGWLADLRPALWKLGLILAAAGGAALALLPLADPVMTWMFPGQGAPVPWKAQEGFGGLQVYTAPDLRGPILGVGLILFLAPSLLLGTVSPYAAKLLIHAIGRLGAGVGKISGVATIGGIVGTLGTTFYLIAWMGTRWLLAANGLVLLGLGALLALAELARPGRVRPEPARTDGAPG